jgi:hypothetical protein
MINTTNAQRERSGSKKRKLTPALKAKRSKCDKLKEAIKRVSS